jgi:hypothetical protein
MTALILFFLTILYMIWLNRLIRFGVRTATRIADACEANARHTAMLVAVVKAQINPPPPLPTELGI